MLDTQGVGDGLRFATPRQPSAGARCLMREAPLQAPNRVGKKEVPRPTKGPSVPSGPTEWWGTDMTTTVTTEEGMASVFVAVDHCSLDSVGESMNRPRAATASQALEPITAGGPPTASPVGGIRLPRG